jgi:hypothetical protein
LGPDFFGSFFSWLGLPCWPGGCLPGAEAALPDPPLRPGALALAD